MRRGIGLIMLAVGVVACARSRGAGGDVGGASPGGSAAAGAIAEPPEPGALPPRSPRFFAISDVDAGLRVIRFDDPSQPERVQLSWPERGEDVDLGSVVWSPGAESLAFVTAAGDVPELWVASASDDFARAPIALPAFDPATRVEHWNETGAAALAFISADVLALAMPAQVGTPSERVAFFRADVTTRELEPIGELRCMGAVRGALFAASTSGLLYGAGECDAPDLMLAAGREPPRRLGAALLADGGPDYERAELQWTPSGDHATWWTWPIGSGGYEVSTQLGTVAQPEPIGPMVERIAEGQPTIGHVAIPLGLIVDFHPHGDLSSALELEHRLSAPRGSTVAYAVSRDYAPVAIFVADSLGRKQPDRIGDPVIGLRFPAFGLLDATTPFYAHYISRAPAEESASFQIGVGLPAASRQAPVLEGYLQQLDAVAGTRRLFAVRDRPQYDLWTLDADDPAASQQRVALDGFVTGERVLQQGMRLHPWSDARAVGEARGELLLLSTVEDLDCASWPVRFDCERTRWLVDLTVEPPSAQPLAAPWNSPAPVLWAPDGRGVLAVVGQETFYVPDPTQPYGFALRSGVGYLIVPDRWP